MKKILILVILVLIIIGGYLILNKSTQEVVENNDYVDEMDQREKQARVTPDATCDSLINEQSNLSQSSEDHRYNLECNKFLELWYEYHSNRLGVSKNGINNMTALDSFSVNSQENQKLNEGITIYRVDYFVNYGDDISILTYDSFPISIPPTYKLYPDVNIPRDNSLFTLKEIKNIGTSFDSNLTNFPLGPLAYATKNLIKKDIQSTYLHASVDRGSIDNVDFVLDFNRSDIPVASLIGSDSKKQNCYSGEHNLLTKEGTIRWSSPCMIN